MTWRGAPIVAVILSLNENKPPLNRGSLVAVFARRTVFGLASMPIHYNPMFWLEEPAIIPIWN